MTVEAAVILPLFLLFFLNLAMSMELMRLHVNLEAALHEVGGQIAVYGAIADDFVGEGDATAGKLEESDAKLGEAAEKSVLGSLGDHALGALLSATYVRSRVIDSLGESYLESSPLSDGAESLQFLESTWNQDEDTFDLLVTYQVSPLTGLVGFSPFRMANHYYGHLWNGYGIENTEEETVFVYVTASGTVYHRDSQCTHIRLSIRRASLAEALAARNTSGERYTPCEKCVKEGKPANCYITSEGNRYHASADCSGLKRTVRTISLKEAQKCYRACSRCGGEK